MIFESAVTVTSSFYHVVIISSKYILKGARGGAVGWGTATNQEVAGSIPDGVIVIFHWHNPTGRNMALGSN